MKSKTLFMSLLIFLSFALHATTSEATVQRLTLENKSHAVVTQGGSIVFQGRSFTDDTPTVRMFYQIYEGTTLTAANQRGTKTLFKTYDNALSQPLFYSHEIDVDVAQNIFLNRGIYTIEVSMERANGTVVERKNFPVTVHVSIKPKRPIINETNVLPSSKRFTVNAADNESTTIQPYLRLSYKLGDVGAWVHSPIPSTTYNLQGVALTSTTKVIAMACYIRGGIESCSDPTERTIFIGSSSVTPVTMQPTIPTMTIYKESSPLSDYYFINFQKKNVTTNQIPMPNATIPSLN